PFGGVTLSEYIINKHPAEYFFRNIVVTRNANAAIAAATRGITVVENDDDTDDIAKTIALGLKAMPEKTEGCMFSVCDAPYFTAESMRLLLDTFIADKTRIVAAGANGQRANPVIFPKELFAELAALAPNESGSAVISRHMDLLTIVDIPENELRDIDRPEDLV
ncbi:MAG: nucleotidyltransferase family protein, partial [Oscillospiraceae bacterium]